MKDPRRVPLIAGVAGAVLVLIMVVGLILPKAGQIKSRQAGLATSKHKEAGLVLRLDQLRAAQMEAPANRELLVKLEHQVPESVDLPVIIRTLQTVADQSLVDFMSVSPAQPLLAQTGTVSSVATQIQVNGSYFSVDEFLYRLESIARVGKVMQVSMTPDSQDAKSLAVTILVQFYTTDLNAGPGSDPGPTASLGTTDPATGLPATGLPVTADPAQPQGT
jgi:Tfp pilus assembly protein PilO